MKSTLSDSARTHFEVPVFSPIARYSGHVAGVGESTFRKRSERLRSQNLRFWDGFNTGKKESRNMPTGKIKWFDNEKGYGFIQENEGGKDLFVHHSETDGYALNEGDTVEYEIGEGRKGPCATKVKKV